MKKKLWQYDQGHVQGYLFEKHVQNKIIQLLQSHFSYDDVYIEKNKFLKVPHRLYDTFEIDMMTHINELIIVWEISIAHSKDYQRVLQKRIERIRQQMPAYNLIVIAIVPDIVFEKACVRYQTVDLVLSLRDVRPFILKYLPFLLVRK